MEYRQWHDHYDYEVPTSLRFPRILVHDILRISANAHPNKPATICNGKSLTFWELRQLVLRMANALKKLGVEKGDRVGLHLPTCPQYVIANHAILSLGAIVVNLNPIYPAEELASHRQADRDIDPDHNRQSPCECTVAMPGFQYRPRHCGEPR